MTEVMLRLAYHLAMDFTRRDKIGRLLPDSSSMLSSRAARSGA
jgi:hypothetical protein